MLEQLGLIYILWEQLHNLIKHSTRPNRTLINGFDHELSFH